MDPPSPPRGGNVGLYGAIVKYNFTVSNSNPNGQQAAYLNIYARHTGGHVFGAAQITSDPDYPERVVPSLAYVGDASTGIAGGVVLTQKDSGPAPVMVPANTTSRTLTVKFTAGGSSSLPGNLYLYALRESAG